MRIKISRFVGWCVAGLVLTGLAEVGLRFYSRASEEQKRLALETCAARMLTTVADYHKTGLHLLKEVLLAEQVSGALQSKTFNQVIRLNFLLQAVQKKSAVAGVEMCVLDEKGAFLAGSSRLREIDNAVVTLGRFGEPRLFARAGDSFYDAVYLEGIAPLMKSGKIAGFAHIELPLGKALLDRARAATGEEVFLLRRDRVEGGTAREDLLKLLRRETTSSQIQVATLDLAAERGKTHAAMMHSSASGVLVPLRGLGGEVTATLFALIPERGFLAVRDTLRWILLSLFSLFTVLLVVRGGIQLALLLSRLTWRTVLTVFLAGLGVWGVLWLGLRAVETTLWHRAQGKNEAALAALKEAYRDFSQTLSTSVGREREEFKQKLIPFLKGEKIPRPHAYEFAQIPLGLREKGAASRLTMTNVPVRWSGAGVNLEKAASPFSRDKGVYKVPVERTAQKLWLVYSSAWGYLNKFGSPFGTTIGRVEIVFQNGGTLDLELKNGVNVHDRFSPPSGKEEVSSWKAFEFISEEDPLHRMQYIEELEFPIPPLYAGTKIEYVVFHDEETPDVPIFYALTLGAEKPAAGQGEFVALGEEQVRRLSGVYFSYGSPDSSEGAPSVVAQWPLPEKEGGAITVSTPAPYMKSLRRATRLLDWFMLFFLLLVGIIGATQVIVSWKKLRFKLVSFSLIVSCVPILIVAWVMGGALQQKEKTALRERSGIALKQSAVFLADVSGRVEDIAIRLCSDAELLQGVEKKEREKIERILSAMKVASLSDFPGSFAVVRRYRGNRVTEEWGTASYRSLPQGAKSLLEGEGSGVVLSPVVCAALGVNQAFLPGAETGGDEHLSVAVGVPLDPVFLGEMKRRASAEISLFVEDNLRATTFSASQKEGWTGLPASPQSLYSRLIKEGKRQFVAAKSDNTRASSGFMVLNDSSGRPAGMLAATVAQEKSFLAGFGSKKILFGGAFLVLALAGLMSYMISRSITSPLGMLSKGAEEIARGELGTQVGVAAKDEIGHLASTFNLMSASLRENQDNLEQKIEDLLTLQKLSAKLSSVLEREELMHLVVKLFSELSGFSKGMLLLRDPETRRWVVQSGIGIRKSDFGKLSYLPEETLGGQAIKEHRMIFVENHLQDERIPHSSIHRKSSEKPLKILALPLHAKGNDVGAVILEHPVDSDGEVRIEEVLLSTLAHHAAIALENARLYEMAVEDGLTKVFVSRYFHFRLNEEVEHAKRYHSHLSLVLLDLDHFKSVNDNYGHPVGDKILIAAAQLMKKTFRGSDVVCRYGGDEFAIILPKTGGEEAVLIAERLRHEVERLDFPVDAKIVLRATLSVGVAEWKAPMGKEELIKAADHALYAAKTGGRNRVSRFEQTA